MEGMRSRGEELSRIAPAGRVANVVATDWRRVLPVLAGGTITLRELHADDAPTLLAMLATEEVARFISPPPTTVEGFERFIAWTHRERGAGRYICFGIVPHGMEHAVGLLQVRQLEPGFQTAEWGFCLGSAFWGNGMFVEAARKVVDFVFDTLGTHRIEARAAIKNGRGNGALRKIGATQEAILRNSFFRNGEYLDQILWSIVADEWGTGRESVAMPLH